MGIFQEECKLHAGRHLLDLPRWKIHQNMLWQKGRWWRCYCRNCPMAMQSIPIQNCLQLQRGLILNAIIPAQVKIVPKSPDAQNAMTFHNSCQYYCQIAKGNKVQKDATEQHRVISYLSCTCVCFGSIILKALTLYQWLLWVKCSSTGQCCHCLPATVFNPYDNSAQVVFDKFDLMIWSLINPRKRVL